ncbi:MAG: outer membrane beta-barrel protein [Bacteroidota bacterium]
MKLVIGCCLLVSCVATTAVAQKSASVNWGVTLGISSTKLNYKDNGGTQSPAPDLKWDRSNDLTGGLFAEIKFAKANWFSMRNDLTHRKYDAESGDYYNGVGQTHAFGSVKAHYLKYSLSVRAAITKKTVQPFVTLGVSPSYLISQTNSYIINYGVTQARQPLLTGSKSFEFGYYGGAGISYNRITGEVRVETSNGLRPSEMTSPVNTVYVLFSYRLLEN